MPVLETRRLRLRPYGEADLGPFVDLVSDRDLMGHLGGPVSSPESLFRRLLRHDAETGELAWAITLHGMEDLIGHIWLQGLAVDGLPEMGFVIRSSHAGRGVATEAAAAVFRLALEGLGLPGIEATVDPDHVASQRVLEKIGMRLVREEHDQEGTFRVYRGDAARGPTRRRS